MSVVSSTVQYITGEYHAEDCWNFNRMTATFFDNFKNSSKDWRKQLLNTEWKSAFNKSKIRVNSIEPSSPCNIKMNGQMIAEVDQFKYLRSTQTTVRTYCRK